MPPQVVGDPGYNNIRYVGDNSIIGEVVDEFDDAAVAAGDKGTTDVEKTTTISMNRTRSVSTVVSSSVSTRIPSLVWIPPMSMTKSESLSSISSMHSHVSDAASCVSCISHTSISSIDEDVREHVRIAYQRERENIARESTMRESMVCAIRHSEIVSSDSTVNKNEISDDKTNAGSKETNLNSPRLSSPTSNNSPLASMKTIGTGGVTTGQATGQKRMNPWLTRFLQPDYDGAPGNINSSPISGNGNAGFGNVGLLTTDSKASLARKLIETGQEIKVLENQIMLTTAEQINEITTIVTKSVEQSGDKTTALSIGIDSAFQKLPEYAPLQLPFTLLWGVSGEEIDLEPVRQLWWQLIQQEKEHYKKSDMVNAKVKLCRYTKDSDIRLTTDSNIRLDEGLSLFQNEDIDVLNPTTLWDLLRFLISPTIGCPALAIDLVMEKVDRNCCSSFVASEVVSDESTEKEIDVQLVVSDEESTKSDDGETKIDYGVTKSSSSSAVSAAFSAVSSNDGFPIESSIVEDSSSMNDSFLDDSDEEEDTDENSDEEEEYYDEANSYEEENSDEDDSGDTDSLFADEDAFHRALDDDDFSDEVEIIDWAVGLEGRYDEVVEGPFGMERPRQRDGVGGVNSNRTGIGNGVTESQDDGNDFFDPLMGSIDPLTGLTRDGICGDTGWKILNPYMTIERMLEDVNRDSDRVLFEYKRRKALKAKESNSNKMKESNSNSKDKNSKDNNDEVELQRSSSHRTDGESSDEKSKSKKRDQNGSNSKQDYGNKSNEKDCDKKHTRAKEEHKKHARAKEEHTITQGPIRIRVMMNDRFLTEKGLEKGELGRGRHNRNRWAFYRHQKSNLGSPPMDILFGLEDFFSYSELHSSVEQVSDARNILQFGNLHMIVNAMGNDRKCSGSNLNQYSIITSLYDHCLISLAPYMLSVDINNDDVDNSLFDRSRSKDFITNHASSTKDTNVSVPGGLTTGTETTGIERKDRREEKIYICQKELLESSLYDDNVFALRLVLNHGFEYLSWEEIEKHWNQIVLKTGKKGNSSATPKPSSSTNSPTTHNKEPTTRRNSASTSASLTDASSSSKALILEHIQDNGEGNDTSSPFNPILPLVPDFSTFEKEIETKTLYYKKLIQRCFFAAVMYSSVDVVFCLLHEFSHHIPLERIDAKGRNVFHYLKDKKICAMVMEFGKQYSSFKDNNPECNKSLILSLLTSGDLERGDTPLHRIVGNSYCSDAFTEYMINIYLDLGVDPSMLRNHEGHSPLIQTNPKLFQFCLSLFPASSMMKTAIMNTHIPRSSNAEETGNSTAAGSSDAAGSSNPAGSSDPAVSSDAAGSSDPTGSTPKTTTRSEENGILKANAEYWRVNSTKRSDLLKDPFLYARKRVEYWGEKVRKAGDQSKKTNVIPLIPPTILSNLAFDQYLCQLPGHQFVTDFLTRYCDMGGLLNVRNELGETVIHAACEYSEYYSEYSGSATMMKGCSIEILKILIKFLIEQGDESYLRSLDGLVKVVDENNNTPLHSAVRSGNLEIVKFLLSKPTPGMFDVAKRDVENRWKEERQTTRGVDVASGGVGVEVASVGTGMGRTSLFNHSQIEFEYSEYSPLRSDSLSHSSLLTQNQESGFKLLYKSQSRTLLEWKNTKGETAFDVARKELKNRNVSQMQKIITLLEEKTKEKEQERKALLEQKSAANSIFGRNGTNQKKKSTLGISSSIPSMSMPPINSDSTITGTTPTSGPLALTRMEGTETGGTATWSTTVPNGSTPPATSNSAEPKLRKNWWATPVRSIFKQPQTNPWSSDSEKKNEVEQANKEKPSFLSDDDDL